jgi:hypothetical protein
MNRRILLRGLGGAVVAAPFLSSLAGRGAKAQAPASPKRLIGMFTHYGCITNRFFPTKSHGRLSAADLESTTLKHLAPFVDKLLMPRGIRAMNEWTSKMLRGQGNEPHFQVGSYFTCQPLKPNSNDPFDFPQSALFAPKAVGPSLDHVIAQAIAPSGVPLLLRVGSGTDSSRSAISYSAAETLFPGFSATQALSYLTGLFTDGAPVSPDSYHAARGKSIIDLVRDDLDTLERFDMSQSDKRKLGAWKELLNQTVNGAVQCGQDVASTLGATKANVDGAAPALGADALTIKIRNTTLDGADLYSSLAVLAAVCQATPVIFLKYPANYIFKGLNVTMESHSLSHRLDNAGFTGTCLPGALDMLLTIDDFYARKYARLVELLDGIDEGDGKVLDNTAAVWFQEMSDGLAHNLNNLPIVHAGSAGGYFKTGWAVNVESGSADMPKGNSEGACTDPTSNMVNGLTQSTGTDATIANAPINKYFCNLMNALGVKAGADGFAAKNGTAEVTRFGMYDKTEDFIGGGTNPPMIHDPGEFDALKANG